MSGPSIRDIVMHHYTEHGDASPEVLIGLLVAREQAMAELLRMAGMQFGMYPQIVAEVLAEVEMGEPLDPPERAFIKAQFQALMEELTRQQHEGGH